MRKSLSPLVRARTFLHERLIELIRTYYNNVWGTRIGEGSRISRTAKIDRTNPTGVVIGKYSLCAFGAAILTHDFVNGVHRTTTIGDYCFIGARAIIMPGVTIGNHCIVGTGSIVTRDIPANSIVAGNPARIIKRDIATGKWGVRITSSSVA